MPTRPLLAAALVALVAPSAARAQAPASAPPPARATVVSIQPLQAIAAIFAGEIERAVSPTFTVGLGATGWYPGALSYTSAELKGRYYVDGTPFERLSVGASAGFTRVAEDVGTGSSASGLTAGAMVDYGWLLGRTRAMYVGVGAGGKVLFVDVGGFVKNVALRYPTVRMSVGRAF